jgi:ABC-type antimicrobial peptide transport system permease subunit
VVGGCCGRCREIGLSIAALLSPYIPAYRASRIDPVKAIGEG